MRRQHVLRANARVELPSLVTFVDTESAAVETGPGGALHRLRFGCAEVWRRRPGQPSTWTLLERWAFDSAAGCWAVVLRHTRARTRMYVFAHNWQFDAAMLGVAALTEEYGFAVARAHVERGRYILDLRGDGRTLALRDSTNYLPMSLAAIGAQIGLEKGALPADDAPADVWAAYCYNDVAVLRTAMQRYIDLIDVEGLGNFAPTTPGQAFAAYRHRFMHTPIYVHDRERVLALERDAYYGGRCECYRLGTFAGPFWLLDVNSLYPSIMRGALYPNRLLSNARDVPVVDALARLDGCLGVARVVVEAPEPVLPVRYEGRLCFPVGTFVTTLPDPELRYALGQGWVRQVEHLALYSGADLFTSYVDTLYGLRRSYEVLGDRAFALVCKLLLNALAGKFGQRLPLWEPCDYLGAIPPDVQRWYEPASDGSGVAEYRLLLGRVERRVPGGETMDSCPSIAATVTSYGRLRLWELICCAGLEHVYYCDTDSLIVDQAGYDALADMLDATALGKLKVETSGAYLSLGGLKRYTLGAKRALKGIRRNAIALAPDVYRQEQFTSWMRMCGEGYHDAIRITQVVKHLSGEYAKGVVGEDGVVHPLRLHQ